MCLFWQLNVINSHLNHKLNDLFQPGDGHNTQHNKKLRCTDLKATSQRSLRTLISKTFNRRAVVITFTANRLNNLPPASVLMGPKKNKKDNNRP